MSLRMDLAPSSSRLHQLPKHQARQRRARRYLDTNCVLPVIPISGFAYFLFFCHASTRQTKSRTDTFLLVFPIGLSVFVCLVEKLNILSGLSWWTKSRITLTHCYLVMAFEEDSTQRFKILFCFWLSPEMKYKNKAYHDQCNIPKFNFV